MTTTSRAGSAPGARIPSTRYIYAFGALGGFLFGFETGVLAGALPFIRDDYPSITATEVGLIVAALAVGAIFGAAASGRLSDRIGRRRVLLVLGVVFIAGSLASAISAGTSTLILSRLVLGVGVGGASALVPVYLAEMAPAHARGRLGGLNQLMLVTGILAGYLVNLVLDPTGNWRAMLATGAVPALALVLGTIRLPESPRWLVTHGREDEARTLLTATHGAGAWAELDQIRAIAAEPTERGALRSRWVRPALVVGIGLAILTQLNGTNAISYYAPTILENVGFGSGVAILTTVGLGVVKVVFVALGLLLIDRVGRKFLLVLGNVVMGLSLLGLALAARAEHPSGILLVLFMALFLAGNEVGWGPTFWVLMGEIFPLRIRGAAMGVASMAVWIATAGVAFAFPVMLDGIGLSASMFIFAALNACAVVFGMRYVTETKGQTLEEIERNLQGHGQGKGSAPAEQEPLMTKTSGTEVQA
ncbi:sugar porter family MFS transporter [Streptomyces sp. NPDC096311]|uniref:sugar porter family MFS transporter n=1 Tax=Streptomyces sp. NPDC096311 TaxID=3366083 RepID=UPI0038273BDB